MLVAEGEEILRLDAISMVAEAGSKRLRHRAAPALFVGPGCTSPAQPVAVNEHDPARHLAIIITRFAVALGRERPQPLNLLVSQPNQGIPPSLLTGPGSHQASRISES